MWYSCPIPQGNRNFQNLNVILLLLSVYFGSKDVECPSIVAFIKWNDIDNDQNCLEYVYIMLKHLAAVRTSIWCFLQQFSCSVTISQYLGYVYVTLHYAEVILMQAKSLKNLYLHSIYNFFFFFFNPSYLMKTSPSLCAYQEANYLQWSNYRKT